MILATKTLIVRLFIVVYCCRVIIIVLAFFFPLLVSRALPLNKLLQFERRNGSSRFKERSLFFFSFTRVELFLNTRLNARWLRSEYPYCVDRSVVKLVASVFLSSAISHDGRNEVAVACNTRHIRGYHENEKVIPGYAKTLTFRYTGTF